MWQKCLSSRINQFNHCGFLSLFFGKADPTFKMTVTRLTSYIHRKMINTPLFPPTQRRRHKDNLQCPGNDPFLAINSDPEPRVLNLGSRHPRVLWSPQSIFNDFDIKLDLAFNNVKPNDWYFVLDLV